MYSIIKNPETGKNVNLNSVKGKNILQKYIENIRFSMRGGSKHLFSSFKTDLENYIIKYPHMTYLNDVYDTKLYNSINSINTPLKIGTDCSGIEAPIMALELLKIPHIHEFSSDIDSSVLESIKTNYNSKKIYNDMTNRNHKKLPEIDVYVAGFPCQSFSNLGKRKGFDDKRGNVFFHCYDVIKYKQPIFFILENVKGLLSHDKGDTFKIIIELLEKLKLYNIYYKVMNTKNFNIPQNRERVYIIGILKSKQKNAFVFPNRVRQLTDIKIVDILENISKNMKTERYYSITPHMNDMINYSGVNRKDNWVMNLNGSIERCCSKMLDISPCLLAGKSDFYITSKKRKFTERETLRLQGFPDSFKISKNITQRSIYHQAGNSMSINILVYMYRNILYSIL